MAESFYDIPKVVDPPNLPFILERLRQEKFQRVTSLTDTTKDRFRSILEEFFTGKLTMDQAIPRIRVEIIPPKNFRASVHTNL